MSSLRLPDWTQGVFDGFEGFEGKYPTSGDKQYLGVVQLQFDRVKEGYEDLKVQKLSLI